ncbi:MAG: hypothetical protein J0J04_08045 [Microbacterium sp.]|uniref:hypothetical protein n=1 Tax=Microbacterium sp. TaxID=51671 RepID=UPI001ACAA3B9|nr:hypothetical protein [Microbacterium sp.]MBN9214751.1 hypothetical protein [Microbacterium sp.]
MATKIRPGDVVHYDPSQHHCREGVAVAINFGPANGVVLVDTYWLSSVDKITGENIDWDAHRLTAAEADTAVHQFTLTGLRPAASGEQTSVYEPEHVFVVPSQHGHVKKWFVHPDAARSNRVILERQRAAVAAAQQKVESAQFGLDCEIRELARLEAAAADGAQL